MFHVYNIQRDRGNLNETMAMSGKPTKFIREPSALRCPVCKQIFREPVISIQCGHTFCTSCIEKLISVGHKCPLDGQMCDSGQLVINKAVKGQIEDLMIHCRHGVLAEKSSEGDELELDQDGCKEVVRLGDRDEHENNCRYAQLECPVGGTMCGVLRQHMLEEHMTSCVQVPCPYSDFGCVFRGTAADVTKHKAQCNFSDESQLLAIAIKEMKSVRATNQELQQSLAKTSKVTEKLSMERSTMLRQLEHQALTITNLTSRMDKLEAELEECKSVQLRQTSSSTRRLSERGELTPRYSRRGNHSNEVKRWSVDSVGSNVSTTLDVSRCTPFIWQMPFTVKCIGTFSGHKGTIWSLVIHGYKLYSGSGDGSIKLWDASDLRKGCLKTLAAHKDCTLCLAIGRGVLYSAGTDLALRSWHLESLDEVAVIQQAHDSMVSAMICSKEYLYTSSFGCIKVWNAVTLKEIHNIGAISQSWVRALDYDKKKDHLYSCSFNKIHIWKGHDDFALLKEMETHYGALYSLALTRKYIVTGTHNQNIQIYNISTLEHVCSLTGHIGTVTVLRVTESAHGVYMFSGSSDSTVQVWNLENMLPILALQRHEKPVHSMSLSQDSVFTGSEDMEIKVFRHFKN